jgi:hypothetical protein
MTTPAQHDAQGAAATGGREALRGNCMGAGAPAEPD